MAYKCWKSQELHIALYLIRGSLCDQVFSHSGAASLLTAEIVATSNYRKQQGMVSFQFPICFFEILFLLGRSSLSA